LLRKHSTFAHPFLYLHIGFENIWQKNIGTKAARKMLMKSTIGGMMNVIKPVFISSLIA